MLIIKATMRKLFATIVFLIIQSVVADAQNDRFCWSLSPSIQGGMGRIIDENISKVPYGGPMVGCGISASANNGDVEFLGRISWAYGWLGSHYHIRSATISPMGLELGCRTYILSSPKITVRIGGTVGASGYCLYNNYINNINIPYAFQVGCNSVISFKLADRWSIFLEDSIILMSLISRSNKYESSARSFRHLSDIAFVSFPGNDMQLGASYHLQRGHYISVYADYYLYLTRTRFPMNIDFRNFSLNVGYSIPISK